MASPPLPPPTTTTSVEAGAAFIVQSFVPIRDASGAPPAGLSIALPTARFDRDALPGRVGALSAAAGRAESALAT